ncbi:uncharacterized protein LOC116253217 [Nymphaea colorata]|uniref:uncharacterized protein LOC116253217 n=1 Tax=Nymphaea colorata TaxID=210225 RepID=UPI00129DC913|nr:uncharacterized protein LOC116253217 [Nymphaea colorata]
MAVPNQASVRLLLCLGMVSLCHGIRPTANYAMSVPLGRMGDDDGVWFTPPMNPLGSWHHGVPQYAGGGGGGSGRGYSYPPYNGGGSGDGGGSGGGSGGGGGGSGGGGGGGYSYPPYNGGSGGHNCGGCSGCEAPGRGCNCGCGCPIVGSWPEYSGNDQSAKRGSNMPEKKDAEGSYNP